MKMRKSLAAFLLTGAVLALGACNGTDEKATDEKANTSTEQTAKEDTTTVKEQQVASLADPRLQEVPEDATCEMCNMKVYTKEHEMGVFSAQAIKADGSIAFYDDIGCLLNAEVANNEKNDKYVRDFNTLEWVLVENVTIVKTDKKSPMNWGYIYFKEKADADKYIKENVGSEIADLQAIKDEALERRKAKMQKMQEQQGNGNANGNGNGAMNMHGEDNMGHNHQ